MSSLLRNALVGIVSIGIATPLLAQAPRSVTIRGVDYAYLSPDTIPARRTLFTFENQGTVFHELFIALLKEGRTASELIATTTPLQRRQLFDAIVGVLFADPKTTAPGKLLATLQKNRTYVLFCVIRDAAEKPMHMTQGMVRLLYVR